MKTSESNIQTKCVSWFRNQFPNLRGLLFSVPNGGTRSKSEAARLKYEGLTPGIPDLVFCFNGNTYFIEMKTDVGKLSDAQKIVHLQLQRQGFEVHVIRDFDGFCKLMTEFVNR